MKRYYYEVGEFTPDNEVIIERTQYENDNDFKRELLFDLKLHPIYTVKERVKDFIGYKGYLEKQIFNWDGSKIEWLNHTIDLFE
jgi:hypothetical protein